MKEMSGNKNKQQNLNDTLLMFKKAMKDTKESIDELATAINDLKHFAEANNGNIVDVNDIARQVFGEIDEEEKK